MNLKITNTLKHLQTLNNSEVKNTSRYSSDEKTKIAKTAKDFESILTSMMIKSMNKTTLEDEKSEKFGGDYFDTIFETEMGKFISQSKSLGLADILYKKITGENLNDLPQKNYFEKVKFNKLNFNYNSKHNGIKPPDEALKRLNNFENIISEASNLYGVDDKIIKSIILAESAANSKAKSKANAKGLMQLIDSTAMEMGVNDIWNPVENIHGGAKYFSQLLQRFNGDVKKALAGYNAGPETVEKYKGIPPFEETKNYVNRVLAYYNHLNE